MDSRCDDFHTTLQSNRVSDLIRQNADRIAGIHQLGLQVPRQIKSIENLIVPLPCAGIDHLRNRGCGVFAGSRGAQ